MALTVTQRGDIQADLGLSADQSVFTNDELDRLYERAASDYNTAVYLGWRQLLADTAKFFNYTAGQSKVDRAAVFDHVKAMVEFWKDESLTAANQVAVVGITPVPPYWKEYPFTELSARRRTLPRRIVR